MTLLLSKLIIGVAVIISIATATETLAVALFRRTENPKLNKMYRLSITIKTWCWLFEYIIFAVFLISLLWEL